MCLFVITYRLWTIYFYCISLISLHTKTFVLPSHTRELTIVQLPPNLILFWLSPVRFLIGDRVLRFILHKKHNRTSNLPLCYISNISSFLCIFFLFSLEIIWMMWRAKKWVSFRRCWIWWWHFDQDPATFFELVVPIICRTHRESRS